MTVTEAIERQCHKRVQGISNNNSSNSSNNNNNNNNEIEPKPKRQSEPVANFVAIKGSGHLSGKVALENEQHLHDEEEDEDRNVRYFFYFTERDSFLDFLRTDFSLT